VKAALLSALRQAFGPRGWQGPTVQSVLRGVTASNALRRPHPRRHNIWELVLHLAYWTHVARERITGEKTPFPRAPRNFPNPPKRADTKAWRADVALLAAEHRALVRLVTRRSPRQLAARAGRWTVADTVLGVALHDTYHAGQIGYLRKVLGG
jgi:uncharacterized damage-inducible protein DinB